jgi:ubiquinone/menaquinone biosynthesis C-methylase UbiE
VKHTPVQQAYEEWAATYDSDRNLTRDLDQQVMRTLLGNLRFDSVLEIGCGTGKNTALLAGIARTVQAVDFSEAMLAKAKEKSAFDNVTFTEADINQPWPCEDRSVNLITCNLVLEHIARLRFVFAEAARVLADGGQFFISELHPFRQYQGVQAEFKRDEETTRIPAFVHHISDFIAAAEANNLRLSKMNEWWHDLDRGKPPRLISFIFRL